MSLSRSYWWREKVYKQCGMNLWVDQVVRSDSGCGCTILPSNGPSTTTRCIRLRPGPMASCVFGTWYHIRPAQLADTFLGRIVSCSEEYRSYLYTPCSKKALDKFDIEEQHGGNAYAKDTDHVLMLQVRHASVTLRVSHVEQEMHYPFRAGAVVVVMVGWLESQLPVQSVSITT
jgi:hypothetical protein